MKKNAILILVIIILVLCGCVVEEVSKTICPQFNNENDCLSAEHCQSEYDNQSKFVKCNPKMDNEDGVYVYYKGRKMTKAQYEEMSRLKVTCNERDWNIDSNLYEEEGYRITGSKIVVKVTDLNELEDISYYIFNNESKDGQFKIILTFREGSGIKINNPILLEEVNVLPNQTYNGVIKHDKILELKPENAEYFYLHVQKPSFRDCINSTGLPN